MKSLIAYTQKNSLIIALALLVTGGALYFLPLGTMDPETMYPTQEECELKTGGTCVNDVLCDYNCPKSYHKGWWMPKLQEENCAQVGQIIGAQDMPTSCCTGLIATGGHPGGYTGECSAIPAPGVLSICSQCGDTICNTETGENKCNCSQDCF